jgi:hypothetical protein
LREIDVARSLAWSEEDFPQRGVDDLEVRPQSLEFPVGQGGQNLVLENDVP